MGKGGCGLVEETANCARGIMALMCCLLCAGPIMLIVGIIVLVAPNDRASNVKKYNDAVTAWKNNGTLGGFDAVQNSWMYADGYSGRSTMPQASSTVTVNGNTDGVHSATSLFWNDMIAPNASTYDQFTYHFTTTYRQSPKSPAVGSSFSMQVPIKKLIATKYKCTQSRCTSNTHSSNCRCDSYDMQQQCERNHGTWQSSGNTCRDGNVCGTCQQTKYLSKACFVITQQESGVWSPSASMTSCSYPFASDDQTYEAASPPSPMGSSVFVSLRSSADPYLELEKLTKGKDDFGLTKAQQRNVGLALVGLGGAITLGMITIGVCLCSRPQHRDRMYQYKAMATGGQYEPMQQGNVNYGNAYQAQPQQPVAYQQYPQKDVGSYGAV